MQCFHSCSYTAIVLYSTRKTKRSSKTDRKQMRKAAGGAKGSIFEESYLLGSLSRMVADKGRLHVLISK